LEKFDKKSSLFDEESYEIVKIFGGFGQIFSFHFFEIAIFG
jgi:hypothetical protein